MERRKPKVDRKELTICVRVTDEQKVVMVAAATAAGLELSGWLRFLALREAKAGAKS